MRLWNWNRSLIFPSLFSAFFAVTKQQMLQHVAEQPDSEWFLQYYPSEQNAPSTYKIISIDKKGYFSYEFMVVFNRGLLLLGLVWGQSVAKWNTDLCGLRRTVTTVPTHRVPLGLLPQLWAQKPSFSLLIPFQDPKSYTELNKKTKLGHGAEIIHWIRA